VRWIWICALGFALLVVQVGAVVHLAPLGGGPDLVLLFVVFLALYGPVEDAPLSGWLLGAGRDALSGGAFGLFAVLFMALSFLLSRIRDDIFLEYNTSHVVNAALATLLVYLAAAGYHLLEGAAAGVVLPASLGVAAWNGALAVPAFWLFWRFARALRTPRRRR